MYFISIEMLIIPNGFGVCTYFRSQCIFLWDTQTEHNLMLGVSALTDKICRAKGSTNRA